MKLISNETIDEAKDYSNSVNLVSTKCLVYYNLAIEFRQIGWSELTTLMLAEGLRLANEHKLPRTNEIHKMILQSA